jgi:hypothetical protein
MKGKAGGGIRSNKLVNRPDGKREPRPTAISPSAVAQLGSSLAFKGSALAMGKGYQTPVGPTSPMGQGPGANRTVHRCGSQATHGQPNRGEAGMSGSRIDRGPRAILGPAPNHLPGRK